MIEKEAPVTLRRVRSQAREQELLRVAGTLGGSDPKAAAQLAREEVLKWANERVGGDLPAPALQGLPFEHLKGGRTCVAAAHRDEKSDLWALRVDDPDKTVAQRVWTTEVVVGYDSATHQSMFSLRLLASSPEESLRVEPAVPGLVPRVATLCGLAHGSSHFESRPWIINSEADADSLISFLTDPARTIPALVLTTREGGTGALPNIRELAKATVGIARVVAVPARFTWILTRTLGKPLSVFNGAVRAYMPGFTVDANPFAHRLYLPEPNADERPGRRVDTALRWLAATESVRRLRLGEHVLSFSAVRDVSLEIERTRLRLGGSTSDEQLAAAQAQIDALKDDLRRAEETHQWLSDEHKSAEERAQVHEQQLKAAQSRIQQLIEQIKTRGDSPDAAVALPEDWAQFVDWCDEALSGRIVLSSRARKELKTVAFSDPALAARCLLWLANEYRDARVNGSDGDLRKPVEEGVHNDRCGADSFEFAWDGRRWDVEWHIKNGGNTRDPARCLRIYYFWDVDSQQVVIATMPAHARTGAT